MVRVVRHWHRLPREAVCAPSLEAFNGLDGLDGALSSLIWWKLSLPVVEGLQLDELEGHFQSKLFCEI